MVTIIAWLFVLVGFGLGILLAFVVLALGLALLGAAVVEVAFNGRNNP